MARDIYYNNHYLFRDSKFGKCWFPQDPHMIGEGEYMPFYGLGTVMHLDEALDTCKAGMFKLKKISFLSRFNQLEKHPLKDKSILWMGPSQHYEEDDNLSNFYGNVKFSADLDQLANMWDHVYLVEMITTPTKTISVFLLSEKDYSDAFAHYDPTKTGGPWYIDEYGQHYVSEQCVRFNNEGKNIHNPEMEFMVEVSPKMNEKLYDMCIVSFLNHEDALYVKEIPHVCKRFSRLGEPCPNPYSAIVCLQAFSKAIKRRKIPTPRVSGTMRKLCSQLNEPGQALNSATCKLLLDFIYITKMERHNNKKRLEKRNATAAQAS